MSTHIIEFPQLPSFDPYWGVCPKCKRHDGLVDVDCSENWISVPPAPREVVCRRKPVQCLETRDYRRPRRATGDMANASLATGRSHAARPTMRL